MIEEEKSHKKPRSKYFRPYPGGPLLEKERKITAREMKEKKRGGTKYLKHIIDHSALYEAVAPLLNKIYCGDAEEILKTFPDSFVDIIVTSPPYNFGQEYQDKSSLVEDALKWDEYFSKLNRIWTECIRVLKPSGRLCVDVQPLFSDYIPTHHIISKQLLDLGLLWKGEILWEKHNYSCKYTAWGSWRSPSMPYLKYTWEFIEIFCKESHRKIGDSSKIDITSKEFKEWVYAKWSIAPEMNMKKFGHPAMFPEGIPYRLIKLFSYVGDIVLDPFNGVGTTTLVANKLNRSYIGIDISKKYCEVAEKRIREYCKDRKLSEFIEVGYDN
jgi:site-specific DNA-methyltransferase (adenine-specific)